MVTISLACCMETKPFTSVNSGQLPFVEGKRGAGRKTVFEIGKFNENSPVPEAS